MKKGINKQKDDRFRRRKEKKRKDYAFQRQFDEKSRITLGCPGLLNRLKGIILTLARPTVPPVASSLQRIRFRRMYCRTFSDMSGIAGSQLRFAFGHQNRPVPP